jgi:hypothetical protein
MNRKLALAAQISLCASALFFALSFYVYGDGNRRPVEEPLPGPTFEVAAPFSLTTSGQFRLEAIVPVKIDPKEIGMPEQPSIPCDLVLSLEGPGGFKTEQSIYHLRHGGRYYFGMTDIYEAEPTELLTRGDYKFQLSNHGTNSTLESRGAMVRFMRIERPTESFLNAMLIRGLGWLTLAVGLLSTIAVWVRK